MKEGGLEGEGAGRLPRGRHGLPREVVAENQRERLLAAIVEAVAEHGYSETTIAQITAASGLSRRTFYEHFSNKEDCFLVAHAGICDLLRQRMSAAAGAESEWPAQVRAALSALLGLLAEHPDLARFFLIGSLGAGDRIAARHRDAIQHLLRPLLGAAPRLSGPDEPSPAREEALAGGLSGLIVRRINAGQGARLSELLPALTELILTPYLGEREAMRFAGREQGTEP